MWRYEQSTGALYDPNGELAGTGYSGAPTARNDPKQQAVPNVGPLPRAVYDITEMFWSMDHGPYCLRLQAKPGSIMYGRGGFLIHGDNVDRPGQASHGCIIMPHSVREQVWTSEDHTLEVV